MATNDSNFQAKINEGTNALSPAKTLPYLTVSSYQHFQNESSPEQLTSPEIEQRLASFQFGSSVDANDSVIPLLPRFRQRSCTIGEVVKNESDEDILFALQQRKFGRSRNSIRKISCAPLEMHQRLPQAYPGPSFENLHAQSTPKLLGINIPATSRKMSIRQAIYHNTAAVFTPFSQRGSIDVVNGELLTSPGSSGTDGPDDSDEYQSTPNSRRGSQQNYVRRLWKRAIMEELICIKAKKISDKADGDRKKSDNKKLDYEELLLYNVDEQRKEWKLLLNAMDRHTTRIDSFKLKEMVKRGVPKDLRSEIWCYLIEQNRLVVRRPSASRTIPPYNYHKLLRNLTSQQHQILIDLGRTFPQHPYFSESLGHGQLSLFNVLKAYSLYDTEVGYCQGLSFIAGILLLHDTEERAFDLLVHLMYGMDLRRQFQPEMMALQVQIYQLSRLLHDRHKDLYDYLVDNGIPTLYAAPWFLTLFSSTFPMGFVARVFDLIFLFGTIDVVFSVAIVLLGDHKELLKHQGSFENINEFLKVDLPGISIIQMERIFNQVFEMDLSKALLSYEVEYKVLNEEMLIAPAGILSSPPDQWQRLEVMNRSLKRQNANLIEELKSVESKFAASEQTKTQLEMQLDSALTLVDVHKRKIDELQSRIEQLEEINKRRGGGRTRKHIENGLGHHLLDNTLDHDDAESLMNSTPESWCSPNNRSTDSGIIGGNS